jgi:sigma-E processing peptidase SpoIIGA
MTAIYTMLNRSGLAALEGDSGDDISIWLFALLAAAGGAAAFVGGRRMRRLSMTKQAEIEITFDSKTVRARGMTDTGNLLTDPLSGRSVAICELEAVKDIFPDELSEFLKSGNAFSSTMPTEYASRLRFIPAKGAIASKASLLCAVLPDTVYVVCDGKRSEADILIAPVAYKLSAGESRALLPPGIIQ